MVEEIELSGLRRRLSESCVSRHAHSSWFGLLAGALSGGRCLANIFVVGINHPW
jgi:hypothetical protein